MRQDYISLDKLQVYVLSRELSSIGWNIYEKLEWNIKKINGDQFIESTDSVAANVAEGYGRFHYLDKVKFYYNARGSLLESRHWFDLLSERGFINKEDKRKYLECYKKLRPALNALIGSVLKVKNP
ncbi:MAG: four helix bundle protein [Candidatus Omnitrophota bacterium]